MHFYFVLQHRRYGEGSEPEEAHGALQRGGERAEGGQAGDGQAGAGVGCLHRRFASKDKGTVSACGRVSSHDCLYLFQTSFFCVLRDVSMTQAKH